MPRRRRGTPNETDRPLYMISVAAELTGVHPQTLRIYERKQLVQPSRSAGNTRLYSDSDIARLLLIQQLTQEGINLAGVMRIIALEEERVDREHEMARVRAMLESARRRVVELEMARAPVVRTELVLVPRGGLQRRGG